MSHAGETVRAHIAYVIKPHAIVANSKQIIVLIAGEFKINGRGFGVANDVGQSFLCNPKNA